MDSEAARPCASEVVAKPLRRQSLSREYDSFKMLGSALPVVFQPERNLVMGGNSPSIETQENGRLSVFLRFVSEALIGVSCE